MLSLRKMAGTKMPLTNVRKGAGERHFKISIQLFINVGPFTQP